MLFILGLFVIYCLVNLISWYFKLIGLWIFKFNNLVYKLFFYMYNVNILNIYWKYDLILIFFCLCLFVWYIYVCIDRMLICIICLYVYFFFGV